MRGIFGQYGLIIISVFFISLFAVFLSFSVGYNKAINVKNEIINILERNNGYSTIARTEINEYLASVGYRTTGDCNAVDEATTGVSEWNSYSMNNTNDGVLNPNNANFCLREEYIAPNSPEIPGYVYYHVKLFYSANIPVIGELLKFEVVGTTKQILPGAGV